MSLHERFDAMLASVVQPVLNGFGLRPQGGAFLSIEGSNFLIVEPQKSVKSAADEILFTFNLKVISARLAEIVDGCHPARATCSIAHWRQRLGGLLLPPRDYWWSFTGEVPDDAIAHLVNAGMPALRAAATDESLRDLWLTGRAPGLSDLQRRIYVSTLLAVLGPADHLSSYIASLESVDRHDPSRERVDRHLRLLASLASATIKPS